MLRDTAFLRLWVGTTASGLATWALPFVLGLAVVDDDLTGRQLGVALAARTVGFLAALPVAGVLADRRSPRSVVAWSAGTAAVASLPLVALDHAVWLLCAAAFVVGAGQGACRPAFQALVPAVVPASRRQEANAAITVAVRASVLLGPTLAGLTATAVGTRPVLVAIGVLWAVAAILPPRPAPPATEVDAGATFVTEFAEGLAEARRHPWFVAGLTALAVVIATGYSVTAVALPITSTAAVLAATVTAYTAGALIGGVLVARWRPSSPGWVALAGLGAYGLAPLALALDAHPVVLVAAYVVVGIGIELFNVPWFTAAQREVPPERLSRVSSLDFLVSYGLAPIGLALITPAIDVLGLDAVLLGCAVACALGPLLAALVPSSRTFSRARAADLGP